MSILKYPRELNTSNLDYIVFNSYEYRPNKAQVGKFKGNTGNAPSVGDTIQLFMPTSTPAVSNANGWGEDRSVGELGMLKRNASIGAADVVNSIGTANASLGNFIDGFKSQFEAAAKGGGSAAKQFGINAIAGMTNRSGNALLALSRGEIYNPNIELLYNGPELRSFGFDYIFIPKSAEEAVIVNKIIKEFKKRSSPEISGGGTYKIPPIWQATYMSNGSKNKNMNAFKRAALVSVSVQANASLDYHMSFSDGMPIATNLSLQFMEVDVITKEDHENSGTNQGY